MRAVVIVPDIEAARSFPADVASAASARRFVRDVLDAWGLEQQTENVLLAVSELVTNAVLHARSGADVVLRLSGGRLRVEVRDSSPVPPTRKRYGPEAGTGRGLQLVESLTLAWGCDRAADGKSVWFELDARAPAAQASLELDAGTLADLADLAGYAGRGERSVGGRTTGGPRRGSRRPRDRGSGGAGSSRGRQPDWLAPGPGRTRATA